MNPWDALKAEVFAMSTVWKHARLRKDWLKNLASESLSSDQTTPSTDEHPQGRERAVSDRLSPHLRYIRTLEEDNYALRAEVRALTTANMGQSAIIRELRAEVRSLKPDSGIPEKGVARRFCQECLDGNHHTCKNERICPCAKRDHEALSRT